MSYKNLCMAGALAFAAAGCAFEGHHGHGMGNPPPAATDLQCDKGAKCELDVTVVVEGKTCIARLANPVVRVKPGNVNMDIEWRISAADYSFPKKIDGIYLKEPSSEFTPVVTGNAKRYKLHNKHGERATMSYSYGVRIYDEKNEKLCRVLDPVIVNEI